MFYNTVIPRSYIDCSETSDVRGDSRVETHLSVFAVLKWGEWFQTIHFDCEQNIFIPTENLQKILNDKTSEN